MHSRLDPATVAMAANGRASDLNETQALAQAVQMTEKFVREHLLQDALQISDNLSQMNSLEWLAVSLGCYKQMVFHLVPG